MLPYHHAKHIVRSEGLCSQEQYHSFVTVHGLKDLPERPESYYSEWESWSDFLGHLDCDEYAKSYKKRLSEKLRTLGTDYFIKRKRGAAYDI